MGFTFSSIFILAALMGLGAFVLRAVREARQRISPVKLLVRIEPIRRRKGSKYE